MKAQAVKQIQSVYGDSLVETLQMIDQVRDRILTGESWKKSDIELMSQAVVKLAVLNANLGEHVAEAFYDAASAETHYKLTREKRKLELMKPVESVDEKGDKKLVRSTVSEADSQAFSDTQDEQQEADRAAYVHKILQIKRSDTSELIDALRSRLSGLRNERDHSVDIKNSVSTNDNLSRGTAAKREVRND